MQFHTRKRYSSSMRNLANHKFVFSIVTKGAVFSLWKPFLGCQVLDLKAVVWDACYTHVIEISWIALIARSFQHVLVKWLSLRETVSFVSLRPSVFPGAKLRLAQRLIMSGRTQLKKSVKKSFALRRLATVSRIPTWSSVTREFILLLVSYYFCSPP